MTQFNFGTIVATAKSGSGLAADLNAWRDALHTTHKGGARPSYAVPGLGWLNDTVAPWVDYVYDGTNDALRGFIDPASHRYSSAANQAKTVASGGVTAHLADWGTLFNMTGSAAQTVAIDTKDSLLAGWWMRVIAKNVTVTINPFGAETIDGLATVLLPAGSSTTVFYDGALFYTDANGGGASAFPVGGVVYVPSSAPPQGFVKMNGAVLSRVTYGGLWGFAQASGNITATDAAWVEGKFSPGDGSTTFRIPDGRGTFVRSWDDARGLDASRALGTYQADAMLTHGHTATMGGESVDHAHNINLNSGGESADHAHDMGIGYGQTGSGKTSAGNSSGSANLATGGRNAAHYHNTAGGTSGRTVGHTHAITVTNYTGAAEVRSKNVALLACIKF
jgi:hypothetical protein